MRADGAALAATGDTSQLVGKRQITFDPALPSTTAFAAALKKYAHIQLNLEAMRDDLIGRCDAAIGTGSDVEERLRAAAVTSTDALGQSDNVTLVEPPFAIVLRELIALISEAPSSAPLLKDL